jgi:hypothetical protein
LGRDQRSEVRNQKSAVEQNYEIRDLSSLTSDL